jgi:hypothetical protein
VGIKISDDWAYKPHIRIPNEKIKKRPKRKGRFPPVDKKENSEHGPSLQLQLEQAIDYCNRNSKLITEDFVFIVKTEKEISIEEKLFERLNLNFSFQSNENSAIVTLEKEKLDRIYNELKIYGETNKFRSYYNRILSIDIPYFTRIDPTLNQWMKSDLEKNIEIELLPNLTGSKYENIVLQLKELSESYDVDIINYRIKNNSTSIRTKLTPQSLNIILGGTDNIWQVREAPQIVTTTPQQFDVTFKAIADIPDSSANTICVLDTGVDYDHPLLKNALIDHIDLSTDGDSRDFKGHGTFVSGIAAYRELENRGVFSPSAKIISVKVDSRDGTEESYLESYIEEAVQRYSHISKIFNLSVLYPIKSKSDYPSDLTYTIDDLAKRHDVLFVVSSGNLEEEIADFRLDHYPLYLSDNKCAVYCGADASTSITVGGVAQKDSASSVAKINQPSPFTRRGHYSNRSKPDVVMWAGNIECTAAGVPIENDVLKVVSLGLSHASTFSRKNGTSHAAPYISNMIANLQNEYPYASANLLKALLIHSASWPDEHFALNAGDALKKALYGKGIPDYQRCAFSTKYSATYIVEDEVRFDEESTVPIYIPKIMKDIYGEKNIRVTLVYDPPVDRGVLGYNLVDLDFKLYKEYISQPKWDSSFRIKWDNVKTDIFRWQRGGWGKEWILRIIPRVRFKNKIEKLGFQSQRYALVISIEDPSNKVDVYDAIENEIRLEAQTMDQYLPRIAVSSMVV